jgi:ATP-dependent RNA helicase DDX1
MKNAECSINFGGTAFAFPPADGFMGVAEAHDVASGPGTTESKAVGDPYIATGPVCLILEPARDLAEQTSKCEYGDRT